MAGAVAGGGISLAVGTEGRGAGTDAVGERESDLRQARLLEEEEEDDEVTILKTLTGDTQVLDEEVLAPAWALGGQGL